ncbi:MAG: hypothetical protein ABI702_16965 [Burkholderiales bacterium]
MSVLDDVINSLRPMGQWQLLLAFVACTAYVLAQGSLVSAKGRRIAWSTAFLSAAAFTLDSPEWMYSAMLTAFAIAGLGLFVASAWLLSRALGFSKPRATAEAVAFAESVEAAESNQAAPPAQPAPSARPLSPHNGPAHST